MELHPINFLTGPVTLSPSVIQAFAVPPISHRSQVFKNQFAELKQKLIQYTQSDHVEILSGSGTLANEVVGQQLKATGLKGLILSNGEFGDRLHKQAQSIGLNCEYIAHGWGIPFDWNSIQKYMIDSNDIGWVWLVMHETSVGLWNQNQDFIEFCVDNNIKIAYDCISAVGVQSIDLSLIDFATSVSGKSLASLPGLCFVFYKNIFSNQQTQIPQYLDLNHYVAQSGIPFTINTNLVNALNVALTECLEKSYSETLYQHMINQLKDYFQKLSIDVVNNHDYSSPNNLTLKCPSYLNSVLIGDGLLERNCEIGYKSGYLIEKNWIQIHLTRNNTLTQIDDFIMRMDGILETLMIK